MKLLYVLPLLLVFAMTPLAFAEITITPASGSGAPGCEETTGGCYIPKNINVDIGEKLIFKNTDTAAHTFTSGDPDVPSTVQKYFDSSLVMAGSTYEWSPTEAGDVPYFCMVHPWMTGSIIVGGGNTTPNPNPIPDPHPTPDPMVGDLEIENQQLKEEIKDLKLENKELKNKVNSLNSEIDELKNQIISMTKEFVSALEQLTQWFGEHISNNN